MPPLSRQRLRRLPIAASPSGLRKQWPMVWLNQHASLVSFAADANLNELGITIPLRPTENTSLGRPVDAFDTVPDPEDDGEDVESFARFMRATKAPPRDEPLAATEEAQAGSRLFDAIGCQHCHVGTIVTAPAGTVINRGAFTRCARLHSGGYAPASA